MTNEEFQSLLASHGQNMGDLIGAQSQTASKKSRAFGGDYGASLGQGVVNLGKALSGLAGMASFGADDPNSGFIDENLNKAYDYLQSLKSDKMQRTDAEFQRLLQDKTKTSMDVLAFLKDNPSELFHTIVQSTPETVASMFGVGALAKVAKVTSMAKAGALAGSVEGALMAGHNYNETGDMASALGAFGLGVVTGEIGGNILKNVVVKGSGKALAETAESVFNKTAPRRMGMSMLGEGLQEFTQETGEALLEQWGKDQALDLNSAWKQGIVGAAAGGVMGGATHPFVGAEAPTAKSPGQIEADRQARIESGMDRGDANGIAAADVSASLPVEDRKIAAEQLNKVATESILSSATVADAIAEAEDANEQGGILRTGTAAADALTVQRELLTNPEHVADLIERNNGLTGAEMREVADDVYDKAVNILQQREYERNLVDEMKARQKELDIQLTTSGTGERMKSPEGVGLNLPAAELGAKSGVIELPDSYRVRTEPSQPVVESNLIEIPKPSVAPNAGSVVSGEGKARFEDYMVARNKLNAGEILTPYEASLIRTGVPDVQIAPIEIVRTSARPRTEGVTPNVASNQTAQAVETQAQEPQAPVTGAVENVLPTTQELVTQKVEAVEPQAPELTAAPVEVAATPEVKPAYQEVLDNPEYYSDAEVARATRQAAAAEEVARLRKKVPISRAEENEVAAIANELPSVHGYSTHWADAQSVFSTERTVGGAIEKSILSGKLSVDQKALMEKLLAVKAVRSATLSVTGQFGELHNKGSVVGSFDSELNHVKLFNGGGFDTLAHEAVHAATHAEVEGDKAFRHEMLSMLKRAKNKIGKDSEFYGIDNVHEFITEAFTNPEFQAVLSTIPSATDKKTLWQQFVTAIANALGLSENQRSMLTDVINSVSEKIDATKDQEFSASSVGELKHIANIPRTIEEQPSPAANNPSLAAAISLTGAASGPQDLLHVSHSERTAFQRIIDKLQGNLQDKFHEMRKILNEAGVTRNDVSMDFGSAVDKIGSLIAANVNELGLEPLSRIQTTLTKAGVSMDQFQEYLTMRHAPEYNRVVAERNPREFNLTDKPGSGITSEEASSTMSEIASRENFPAYEQAAAIYDQMMRDVQDYAVERKVISAEVRDAWRDQFQYYTPFKRDMDAETNFLPTGQGLSVRHGVSRAAMGSEKDILDPLATTLQYITGTVTKGEKTRAMHTLVNFLGKVTPKFKTMTGEWKPMFSMEAAPKERVVKQVTVRTLRNADGSMIVDGDGRPVEFYSEDEVREFKRSLPAAARAGITTEKSATPELRAVYRAINPNAQERATVRIPNGDSDILLRFDEESEAAMSVLSAIKNLESQPLGSVMKVFSHASRWVSATATGYNPAFGFLNQLRDVPSAALNAMADEIPGWTVADSTKLANQALNINLELIKHLNELSDAKLSGDQVSVTPGSNVEWYEKLKAAGGITSLHNSFTNFEDSADYIRRMFNDKFTPKKKENVKQDILTKIDAKMQQLVDEMAETVEGEKRSGIGKALGYVATRLKNFNEGLEMATRVAAFKAAHEKFTAAGDSDAVATSKAATVAKNISINFDRRGHATTTLNALFPFFNAAAQGIARLGKTVTTQKVVTDPVTGAKETVTELSPYGKKLIVGLMGAGAAQALILAASGFDDDDIDESIKDRNLIIPMPGEGKGYLTIPMPLGFNVFFNMGREAADMFANPNHASRHMANVIAQPINGFNPLGSGSVGTMLTPALLDIPVSLWANKDAFGGKIAKDDFPGQVTPGFTRGKTSASSLGTSVAEMINWVSGGDEYSKGALSPTPDQIDYVFSQITGGLGREFYKATRVAASVAGQSESQPWYKAPLVDRFVNDADNQQQVQSRLYKYLGDIEALAESRKAAIEAGDRETADEILRDNPQITKLKDLQKQLRADTKTNKQVKVLREEGEYDQIDEIRQAQLEKQIRLRDEIKRIMGE